MNATLHKLATSGVITWLSYYFAEFIIDQSGDDIDGLLAYSAALVSESNQSGHVCIDLSQFSGLPLFDSDQPDTGDIPQGIEPGEWVTRLLQSPCVETAGGSAPLLVEDLRLYLNRFWFYEEQVARKINLRLDIDIDIDEAALAAQLQTLFTDGAADSDQKIATALAACKALSVISGGPGTGKTTTVIKILSLLLSQQPQMRIALAAPTGKAAARMMESIRLRIDQLDIATAVKSAIPTEASTIHRLLGFRLQKFRYNHRHCLPVDCVVIDEASMVDLPLMYRLLDALPDHARIILLGDRDQLASVSAGNVLGDITGHGTSIAYSATMRDKLARIAGISPFAETSENEPLPMANSIALLSKNFRFDESGKIGVLSAMVNQGLHDEVIELLLSPEDSVNWIVADTDTLSHDSLAHDPLAHDSLDSILQAYHEVIQSNSIAEALDAFDRARVLCAVNYGPFGVIEANRFIENRLALDMAADNDGHYHGRPLLIGRNDYDLELFNGDTGIVWCGENNRLQAWFRCGDRGLRHFPLHQLPQHSTAWAMTVHKSQGSEFGQVVIILPTDEKSPLLSRELLYTGITRAKYRVTLIASENVLSIAIDRITSRNSGLAKKLGWPDL